MKKVFVFVLPLITFAAFSQTPTGKIVLKKGQHFVIDSKSDGAVTQEMAGQSMAMTIGSTTKTVADVKESKNDFYTITQTVTNLKSTFSGMGQEKTFDSDKKEDLTSEAGAMFKDKLNVPKDIVISNEGKNVVSADTSKKVADTNPMSAMMDMMGGGQDNASASLFLVIPAGKKAGESWQDSTSSDGVKLKRTYTLNSIINKQATVTINGLLAINKTMQVQGMDMNAVMTSKISSTVLVDLATNIQKENKSITDVNGTIDVMGQSVPVTSKITTATTITTL